MLLDIILESFHLPEEERAIFFQIYSEKILLHTTDTKVVVFDISCQYPFLLMDLFADPSIESKIILENPVKNPDQFYISVVKPIEYEE